MFSLLSQEGVMSLKYVDVTTAVVLRHSKTGRRFPDQVKLLLFIDVTPREGLMRCGKGSEDHQEH